MLGARDAVSVAQSLRPAARTSSLNGAEVDLAGFERALIIIDAGVVTDGSHAISVEESADGQSGWTTVSASELEGTAPTLTSTTDDQVYELGYVGRKRFIRVVTTISGAPSTGGVYSATVVRMGPSRKSPH